MTDKATLERPFVWQMIRDAIMFLNGKANYSEIQQYINKNWQNVNPSTINAQIISLSVNQPSRTHYPSNSKPRISDTTHDLLFSVGRGQVVKYDPREHGIWEIFQNEYGGLEVRQVIESSEGNDELVGGEGDALLFPLEAHLRDFLISNLATVKNHKLKLFRHPITGHDGKEFPTAVGPIDILTTDEHGDFFVFELKLARGADKALGQLLRYMGWVKKHLANGKTVKGIIVANKMDKNIRYAVTITPDISLYEYELKFELTEPVD